MIPRLLLCLLFLSAGLVQAAPVQYEASTLKYLYTITIDRKKDTVKGVFMRSEYGVNQVKYGFTGKLVAPPKGQKGQGILVKFSKWQMKSKGDPYSMPPDEIDTVWRWVETRVGPRIYVTMASRVYSNAKPPRWKASEMVFEPKR